MSAPSAVRNVARAQAARRLEEAAVAPKCWPCGCFHSSLTAIEQSIAAAERLPALAAAMTTARARLAPVRYDCLGCAVCYPAIALNNVAESASGLRLAPACPTEPAELRPGWPPLPGTYTALRHRAPVAVCTLTDDGLAAALVRHPEPALAIVGTLQTENLGIERIIWNLLANPNVRFLVLCGADSRQAIGHLPGASFLALARSGLDERSRIIGAPGKRPVIRNVSREAVEHFRRTVQVVDLIGADDATAVDQAVRDCAARDPGPAPIFDVERVVRPIAGQLPERMVPDPAGYFVIYVDAPRKLLSLEHFTRDGRLDAVIDGTSGVELATVAIDQGLVTRLDHAAYLGRELARAEQALAHGRAYVQDGAPAAHERSGP